MRPDAPARLRSPTTTTLSSTSTLTSLPLPPPQTLQTHLAPAPPPRPPPPFAPLAVLAAAPLSSLPLAASPLAALSLHPPALHLLSTLLPRTALPLSPALRAAVLYAAGRGARRPPGTRALSAKEAAAAAFVARAGAVPARVRVADRRTLEELFSAREVERVVLCACFAGFWGAVSGLLGLEEEGFDGAGGDGARASLNLRDAVAADGFDYEGAPATVGSAGGVFGRLRIGGGGSGSGSGSGSAGGSRVGSAASGSFGRRSEEAGGGGGKKRRRWFGPGGGGGIDGKAKEPANGGKDGGRGLGGALRLRAAARALRAAETYWLAKVPAGHAELDRYLHALCGFVPEYTRQLRSADDRRALVFVIAHLCDPGAEAAASPALRWVLGYVMATAAENPPLAAHAAFLADRFGADLTHLQVAADLPLLLEAQASYTRIRGRRQLGRRARRARASSSVTTEGSAPGRMGRGGDVDLFDDDDLFDGVYGDEREDECEEEPEIPSMRMEELDVPPGVVALPDRVDPMDRGGGVGALRRVHHRPAATALVAAQLDDGFASDDSSSSSGSSGTSTTTVAGDGRGPEERGERVGVVEVAARIRDHLGFELEVPEDDEDEEGEERDEVQLPNMRSLSLASPSGRKPPLSPPPPPKPLSPSPSQAARASLADDLYEAEEEEDDDDELEAADEEDDSLDMPPGSASSSGTARVDPELIAAAMQLFSERDVAVLVLAHQAARSARATSRASPHAVGRMCLGPAEVAALAETLPPPAIAEAVSVVAAHVLLQRFTAAFPYRSGALEAAVRRFVQGPVGHVLGVSAVGQRPATRDVTSFGAPPASRMVSNFGTPNMPYPQTRRMMSSL